MAGNVRQLRPAGEPPRPRLVCKRPNCSRPVERDDGRPSDFCSSTCQLEYQKERADVRRQLKDAHRLAAQYEWDELGRSLLPKRGKASEAPAGDTEVVEAVNAADTDLRQTLLELLHVVQLVLVVDAADGSAATALQTLLEELAAARDVAYRRLRASGSADASTSTPDVRVTNGESVRETEANGE